MYVNSHMTRSDFESHCRSHAMAQYLGDKLALCRVLGGALMYVDTSDYALAPHLMMDGFWESWITLGMMKALRPGMVAIDIGANLGYYSVLMGKSVGPAGKVHVFEPNNYLSRLIHQSLSVAGTRTFTVVDKRAVYSQTGSEVLFYIPTGHPMNALIVDRKIESAGETVAVSTVRLDDAVEGKVDFIKIDAEGAEREIWRGMDRIIQENPDLQIFLEFNPGRRTHYNGEEFLDQIESDGFKLAIVDGAGNYAPTSRNRIISDGQEVVLHLKR